MAMQVQHVLKNTFKVISNGKRPISSSVFTTLDDKNVKSKEKKLNTNTLHLSAKTEYPVAAQLNLPSNIDPTESTKFSPQRARDISGSVILSHQSQNFIIDVTLDNTISTDPHVSSYDCFGAVSLNSVMQSNVPNPFGGMHKFSHLNMPGGQWEQGSKFMSNDLQSSHYTNLRKETRMDWDDYDHNTNVSNKKTGILGISTIKQKYSFKSSSMLLLNHKINKNLVSRYFSLTSQNITQKQLNQNKNTSSSNSQPTPVENLNNNNSLSRKEKLKKAIKEYGTTVIIFHVSISLVSLGTSYILVSSGLDVISILEYFGLQSALSEKVASGSKFVLAYAIHKVFAPVRISITLGCTPLIVRYLRKRGILKPPTKT